MLFTTMPLSSNMGIFCLFLGSISSLTIGTLGALKQSNIKRFVGYSSISHIGFILIGSISCTGLGFLAQEFYIVVYLITSIGLFSALLSSKINGKELKEITQLLGVGATHKIFSLNFTVVFFSIAGIPPLAGFFSKIFILGAAIQENL